MVNNFSWVIGQIALDLEKVIGDRVTFLFFSTTRLRASGVDGRAELERLVAQSDVVHVLDPYAYKYVEEFPFDRPTVAPVYHVLDWADEAPNATADAVFVISEEWRTYLRGRSPAVDAHLLRLGVDTSTWTPARTRATGSFRIGFFANADSNASDRKGVAVLLEAVRRLAADVAPSAVELVLSGFGWEPLIESLDGSGVTVDYSTFASRAEMRRRYRSLDTYVMASTVEGGPATLLEAMACGIPPISTPVGIAREAVLDRENGLVVPPGDVDALVKALHEMRGTDRRRLGEAARATVVRSFDIRDTYEAALDLYADAERAFAARGGAPTSTAGVEDPATQRATVELEDRLQHLLIRRHSALASLDLLPSWSVLLRRRPGAALRAAGRWGKFEAVSRSVRLRRLVRGDREARRPIAVARRAASGLLGRIDPSVRGADRRGDRRLLFLIGRLTVGGAAQVAVHLLERLVGLGWQVEVVATGPSPHEWQDRFEAAGCRVTTIGDRYRVSGQRHYLRRLAARLRPTAIIVSTSATGYLALPELRRASSAPILEWVHAYPRPQGARPIGYDQRDLVTLHVCVSADLAAHLRGLGYDPAKIRVVRNGTPCTTATTVHVPPRRVAFVGRVSEEKNPGAVVAAAAALAPHHPDVAWDIVGDGTELPAVQRSIQDTGAPVTLHPPTAAAEVLRAADVLVLPSRSEGISLVVLEAMMAGKAVIATRVGGLPEVLDGSTNGLLIDPDDLPSSLVAAVERLLDEPTLASTLGRAAHEDAVSRWSVERMVDEWVQLLATGPTG